MTKQANKRNKRNKKSAQQFPARWKILSGICEMKVSAFSALSGATTTTTPHGPMVYQDNGADILAVAHLDHVLKQLPLFSGDTIQCGQLDDRLGVWGLLHGLRKYTDTKYDILLCDSEEIGQSTAQYFTSAKQYNWGFELDRAGTDCVLYDYAGGALERRLRNSGWTIGNGAFSDISYLTNAGCDFVNFGIGYHAQHTTECFANMSDVEQQLERVGLFLDKYSGESAPYDDSWKYDDTYNHNDGYYNDNNNGAARKYCTCDAIYDNMFCRTMQHDYSWKYCPYCAGEL